MKALLVDDERLARLELRRLLAEHPEVEIVGEARIPEAYGDMRRTAQSGGFLATP